MADAYNFIRSRRRARTASYPDVFTTMATAGRSPDVNGNFKTRPGATPAWQDARAGRPGDQFGSGMTPTRDWNNFFISHRNDPTETPNGASAQAAHDDIPSSGMGPSLAPENPSMASDIAPGPDDPFWNDNSIPDPSNPSSYLTATMNSQAKYFNGLGVPIPQPGLPPNPKVPPLPSVQSISPDQDYLSGLNF